MRSNIDGTQPWHCHVRGGHPKQQLNLPALSDRAGQGLPRVSFPFCLWGELFPNSYTLVLCTSNTYLQLACQVNYYILVQFGTHQPKSMSYQVLLRIMIHYSAKKFVAWHRTREICLFLPLSGHVLWHSLLPVLSQVSQGLLLLPILLLIIPCCSFHHYQGS